MYVCRCRLVVLGTELNLFTSLFTPSEYLTICLSVYLFAEMTVLEHLTLSTCLFSWISIVSLGLRAKGLGTTLGHLDNSLPML